MSYSQAPTHRPTPRDGDILAVFDFSFEKYAAPKLIKILYAAYVIVMTLGYVAVVVVTFATTFTDQQSVFGTPVQGSPWPVLLVGAGGFVSLIIMILSLRVGLELVMSIVRTSIDARALRDRYVTS